MQRPLARAAPLELRDLLRVECEQPAVEQVERRLVGRLHERLGNDEDCFRVGELGETRLNVGGSWLADDERLRLLLAGDGDGQLQLRLVEPILRQVVGFMRLVPLGPRRCQRIHDRLRGGSARGGVERPGQLPARIGPAKLVDAAAALDVDRSDCGRAGGP